MIRKALTQLRQAARRPGQLRRVVASELAMRAGLPRLRSVEYQVTHACNLRCDFCYAEDLMYAEGRRPPVPLATFRRVMVEARDLGMIHVNVTGGEPLTRPDVADLVDAVPKDVVVSLVTNSTLLTEEAVEELARAGLSALQMSYGTNYPDFSLDRALHAAERGLGVTLSVVNVREERGAVEAALGLARRHGFSVLFNYPMRYNNSGLDPELYWRHRYDPLVREDNLFWAGRDRCPAGTRKLYVTNDGDVMACNRIHRTFGHVEAEPLAAIWERMRGELERRRAFCLLETDAAQWEENNRRSGRRYPLSSRGSDADPFNVLSDRELVQLGG